MTDEYPDRISEIFIGKNILITGGTGFVGKVFLEKILHFCPNVNHIYLLIRAKKGKNAQTRLKEFFSCPLFDKLKSIQGPEILENKCRAINGDVSDVDLGISAKDRKFIIENIDLIYHSAATVRFDETLKNSLLMNTRGTKYMLELAKECIRLQMFCHVSTAYVNPNEKILREKVYPPVADPETTIEILESMSVDEAESLKSKYMGNLPNSYTFTKSLSESLVNKQMNNLPVIIVRPSVVIPIWKEPLPGWGQNINGPMGLLIGAGKGIVRSMYCKGDCYADFLPVDVVANALFLCTWDYITTKERRIYNFISSDEVQITWNEIIETGKKISTSVPFNAVAWYPGGGLKSSKIHHYIAVLLFQILPAIFVDILLYCFRYKPILLNIQKRIIKGYELLEFYATNQWMFDKTNLLAVKDKLNPLEVKKYYINKDGLVIEDYIRNAIYGARRYVMNEPDDTLPAARRHLKIMWCVDVLVKLLTCLGFMYLFYKYTYLSILSP